jgi:hypothetical protein
MDEQNPSYPMAPTYPLSQLTTLPLVEQKEAKSIMQKHGCKLEEHPDECIVFFPEGTTKIEIYPRTRHPRYRIVLPDGYELREVYDRYQEISLLSYQRE